MWNRKHILSIRELDRPEIETIFSLAESFKELSRREVKKTPALRGKTVVNLFFESSTRTRISFEIAAKRLSADVLNFSSSTSSLNKGESIVDTVKNLESYHPDIFVIRTGFSASMQVFTRYTRASIINAGDGANEHPTQALLDMFTIREARGTLDNLKVLVVGDIAHSRVARSNIFGLQKFSSSIRVCGPVTLIPYEFGRMGVEVFDDLDRAIEGVDAIIMLRIQKERQEASFFPSLREYVERFSLTSERIKKAKEKCLIMHPGPINWDVEISSSLKKRLHPFILHQAGNGLAVRMAVLYLAGTRRKEL